MDKNIEAEVRSFISKSQYYNLLKFFKRKAKFWGQERQITYYFSGKDDLRLQKSSRFAKLWLKKWQNIHDDCREEMEIKFDKGYFEECKKSFQPWVIQQKSSGLGQETDFSGKGLKYLLIPPGVTAIS